MEGRSEAFLIHASKTRPNDPTMNLNGKSVWASTIATRRHGRRESARRAAHAPDSSDGRTNGRNDRHHIGGETMHEQRRGGGRRAGRPNPYPQQQCQALWHTILAYFVEYVQNYTVLDHRHGSIWNRASGVLRVP